MAGGGGEGISPKSVLGLQMIKKTIFSHIKYLFLFYFFIFFRTLNSFTPLGISGVKIQSSSNLQEGVLRGQKCKNCSFFSQSIENQKLYNISKTQPPKSIRRGDMGFSLLDLKKVLFLPYLSSK